MPSFNIGGMSGIILVLYMVAIFGTAHLLALSFPDATISKSWRALGF